MRRNISQEVKNKAAQLRKNGYSIGQISKELFLAKSTIHQWVKTLEGAAYYAKLGRKKWLKEIQPMGALAQRKKREKKITFIELEVQDEISRLQRTPDLEKSVLSALYWAEGSKGRGMLSFANTDPRLMALFITLLRRSYHIDESKFRIRMHLHWYHKEREVKKYWSELLKIPKSQFTKTYHKRRSKEKVFRKNIGGICFLIYNSDYLREQIVHFGYALGEKLMSP